MVQAETRSQELQPGLPLGWPGPTFLGHLLLPLSGVSAESWIRSRAVEVRTGALIRAAGLGNASPRISVDLF